MVVKSKEYFEKTRNIKNNDKSKKIYSKRTKKHTISRKNIINFH